MKILVTCPPMLKMIHEFESEITKLGFTATTPVFQQILNEKELLEIVPGHDGWIVGDDPVSRELLTELNKQGFRGLVKWGVGTDNVDLVACNELGIPFTNTPNMFGNEVADLAIGYLIALARETFQIDAGIRSGEWPKPTGVSLAGKTAAIIGFGDVGKRVAKRLLASELKVVAYDPFAETPQELKQVDRAEWPNRLEEADFLLVTSALTESSFHLVNSEAFTRMKQGIRIVNVGRGPVIDEEALEKALMVGKVYSAALDVFEVEPLPINSPLRQHPRCIFGSHNASNTREAVMRTSEFALHKLSEMINQTNV